MKYLQVFITFLVAFVINGISYAQNETQQLIINTVVIDSTDKNFGYYLLVKPKSEKIKGVLVLLPGLGQKSEDIFLDTQLHEHAFENDLLTIGFAGRTRMTADSLIQEKMSAVLKHVIQKHKVDKDKFIFGGFSAGGVIALRYVELCKEFPEKFPVEPKGVFMADSPVDLYHSWSLQEENLKNNYSDISVNEAKWVGKVYRYYYGATPSDDPTVFIKLSPFSINKEYGENEKFLKDVAVRAYHDVDIVWRLKNRNQTVRFDNYVATSELINRLMLMGNERAEFIQTFQTGFRRTGERHPHSWSIIDESECIEWINNLLK